MFASFQHWALMPEPRAATDDDRAGASRKRHARFTTRTWLLAVDAEFQTRLSRRSSRCRCGNARNDGDYAFGRRFVKVRPQEVSWLV